MGRRRVCRACRKAWLRYNKKDVKARMKETGKKMREFYPDWVWHDGSGRHCDKHRAYRRHLSAKRRSAKRQACPDWADMDAIRAVYEKARRVERETGRKMHVDHIVPLQHDKVCGLHVAANLQVIPASENAKKSNRFQVG